MDISILEKMFKTDIGSKIYAECEETLKRYSMDKKLKEGTLIGFSGGADSCMLLCFILEWRRRNNLDFSVVALHVNHGIRGEEADRDEEFSKEFSKSLNVEFHSVKLDVPSIAKSQGLGLEEAARNIRYKEFTELIQSRNDIKTISVAHNANDNAETVIFNTLRGSGLKGTCGIAPVRDNIVRPLIRVKKKDICNCLDLSKVKYVFDSTNGDDEYTRNYIRLNIIPMLERLNKTPIDSFSRMSENLYDDMEYLEVESSKIYSKIKDSKITNKFLSELHPAIFQRVFTLMCEDKGIPKQELIHIKLIREQLKKDNFSFSLFGDYNFVCERGVCFFQRKTLENDFENFSQILKLGINKLTGFNAYIEVSHNKEKTFSNVYNFSIQAELSSAIIIGDLFVRFKTDGDSYRYGNMTHKLKKVFNDRNIPKCERAKIPVICDQSGILWVPGMSPRSDGEKQKSSLYLTLYTIESSEEKEIFTAEKRK